MSVPPPTPWMTRAPTRSGSVGAAAHKADPIVNTASARTNERLRPNVSASQLLTICATPTAAR